MPVLLRVLAPSTYHSLTVLNPDNTGLFVAAVRAGLHWLIVPSAHRESKFLRGNGYDYETVTIETMKTIGILALVLLLVLVGLPLAMGMGMDGDPQGHCPACTPDAPLALAMCLGILSLFSLTVSLASRRMWLISLSVSPQTPFASLFRPPRTA